MVTAMRARLAQVTDERADLRAAVEAAADAKAKLAEHQRGIERAKMKVAECASAVQKAEAMAAEGARRRGQDLAVALGAAVGKRGATQAGGIILAAKATAATEALETARAALEFLNSSRPEAEHQVALADNAVLVEINKLIAPSIERMLAEAEAHRKAFVQTRAALRALCADFERPPGFSDREVVAGIGAHRARLSALGPFREGAAYFATLGMYHTAEEEFQIEYQHVSLFRDARARLRSDPDAQLPEVD